MMVPNGSKVGFLRIFILKKKPSHLILEQPSHLQNIHEISSRSIYLHTENIKKVEVDHLIFCDFCCPGTYHQAKTYAFDLIYIPIQKDLISILSRGRATHRYRIGLNYSLFPIRVPINGMPHYLIYLYELITREKPSLPIFVHLVKYLKQPVKLRLPF